MSAAFPWLQDSREAVPARGKRHFRTPLPPSTPISPLTPAVRPAPAGEDPPRVSDPNVERLRCLQVWQLAYCRDVVKPLTPNIQARGLSAGTTMVGRAYTVHGPDIYLNALEGVGPGQVYVQAGCSETDSVFSPGWTHAYLAPRGAVGVVVDGGVYKSFECGGAAVPMFSRFVSPAVAVNYPRTASVGSAITIGGVTVRPGDIIAGDADGVVAISQADEADLMHHLDGYLAGNSKFGQLAARHAIAAGVPMTEQPALADMFARKYANPQSYWREYEGWWAQWKDEYGDGLEYVAAAKGAKSAFYSGKEK